MRISDWSSDVCSSDLADLVELASAPAPMAPSAALREMAYRADAWTPQESDRLRVLFAADAALADIAAEIGRGRAAVAARLTLLGLRRNSARPWTDFAHAELFRRYGSEPPAALASHPIRNTYWRENRWP